MITADEHNALNVKCREMLHNASRYFRDFASPSALIGKTFQIIYKASNLPNETQWHSIFGRIAAVSFTDCLVVITPTVEIECFYNENYFLFGELIFDCMDTARGWEAQPTGSSIGFPSLCELHICG